MESEYLRQLSVRFQHYRYVLIYGAGGVTMDFLLLLNPYLRKENVFIVVSKKKNNENWMQGYQVKEIAEFAAIRSDVFIVISVMPRYVPEIENYLKSTGFPNYCTVAYLIEQLYEEIWKNTVDTRKIVFANGDRYGFGGNPKYIAQELLRRNRDLDLVWITGKDKDAFPEGVRTVLYGTYEHYYELGTAQIWIDNQHKSYYTRKKRGQIYIQTWHGGGPLKKIEFDAEGLPVSYLDLSEMNAKMEDLLISPSKFNSGLYRSAFHYQGDILECGYPRNDIFYGENECRRKVEKLFGIKQEDGILLFAPTYRNFEIKEQDILNLTRVQQAVERKFGRNYRILVRFHPFDIEPERKYRWSETWLNVTDYDDVQELLAASDILITDYSSVMWDFSLQMKPVFLFHPDLYRYQVERGYYLPFEKMPYVEMFSNEEMEQKIATFDEEIYKKKLVGFLTDYGSFDKGTASKVVADVILGMIEERTV